MDAGRFRTLVAESMHFVFPLTLAALEHEPMRHGVRHESAWQKDMADGTLGPFSCHDYFTTNALLGQYFCQSFLSSLLSIDTVSRT